MSPAKLPPRSKPARRRRIPLGVKFAFFLLLTIGAMTLLTTWLTYRQQQRTLREEIVQRGVTIARSLAASAAEAVLNDLVCAALIHETMPREDLSALETINFRTIVRSLVEDITGYSASASGSVPRNAGVVEVLMVDTNGIIVAHNNIQMVSKPYEPPAGLKPHTGELLQVQEFTLPGGEKRYDIAEPIFVNRTGLEEGKRIGSVHLRMSQRLVDLITQQAALKLLLVLGLLSLLSLAVAALLSNYLTRPIHELVGGVLAIAAGDLNQELRANRNDELGELTAAFNQMAASLREKELIKGAFSTYVSKEVMEQVLEDPARLALGGARKRVSVLFSDIRGFTSMSESIQPEEVVSIINVYLSLQTEIVLRNFGMLDKFVGDCVMAVFGLPWAKPDDALRAVQTAVEIQQAVCRLNVRRSQEGLHTVALGIGVNTGDVVAGNMGSSQKMDYTVIGDAVNLSARLEANAEGGTILISEGTYQEVKDHIEAEKLAPIPVKGKKDKVVVYHVKGMKA